MPKLFKGLTVVLFVLFAAGCASTKPGAGRITTKAYIADKERVDQGMQGNFGYFAGTPKPDDRSQFKKTRKVYVLEVTKEPGEASDTTTAPAPSSSTTRGYEPPAQAAVAEEPRGRTIELPDFDEERAAAPSQEEATEQPASGGGQEYTVQKDDTLQKISKKFYNTYSKWPKIYEANKEVIKNPNRIKPGIKIQIP